MSHSKISNNVTATVVLGSGGYGTTLLCRDDVAGQWWDDMTRWGRLYRPQRAEM